LLEAVTGQGAGEIAVRPVQTVAQIVQHTGCNDLGPAKREVLRAIGNQRLADLDQRNGIRRGLNDYITAENSVVGPDAMMEAS
jgi:hypothetical protein